jgi:hypothetical protein
MRAFLSHRGVQSAAFLWITGYIVVLWLSHGSLPFDRPAIARLPFTLQLAMPTIGMIEVFVLMAVTVLLTRTRTVPNMAARAPERRAALRETIGLLVYAALGQIGGWVVGPALGYRPSAFTLPAPSLAVRCRPRASRSACGRYTIF